MLKKTCNLVYLTILICSISGSSVAQTSYAQPTRMVIPCGNVIGVRLQSDGIMVVGVEKKSAASRAGLKIGDIIVKIGDSNPETISEFVAACSRFEGQKTEITIRRKGELKTLKITPETQIGLQVRDSASGVGTLTFYDPQTHKFGAIGHSVGDIAAGVKVPIKSGSLVNCKITDVRKGEAGNPGEIRGALGGVLGEIGSIETNSESGVFGEMDVKITFNTPVPVAPSDAVKTGPAKIISTVEGNNVPQEYEIEIQKVQPQAKRNYGLVVEITDPFLIEKTGGIVQGMSGSPIIQDGQFIGALTHVFVNEPTRGYGVLADEMM